MFQKPATYLLPILISCGEGKILEIKKALVNQGLKLGDPSEIRTRVTAVKGRCPRPLDDRVGRTMHFIIHENFSFCKHFFIKKYF